MSNNSNNFSELLANFQNTNKELVNSFEHLNSNQLNWKPSAEGWSIGQCVDHLAVTNAHYFPILEKVLKEEKRTFWEKLPFFPSFFAKVLLGYLDPKAQKKIKTPKVFEPASSNIDKDIIKKFSQTQNKLMELMKKTKELPLDKIIITSPISPIVTYSLIDAYTILSTHDRRHFDQALRVYQLTDFPKNN